VSSAAKLRKYGRGTAVVASAALVMTSFGPAAFAAWDTPNASQAGVAVTDPNTGTIGIVDTDARTVDNQGATLVQAGQTGQSIADVRLVIPNRFRSGDVIDLRLFDRSATETSNGSTNSGPSTAVGFSAVPTLAVDGPQNDETRVHQNTDDTTRVNTEAVTDNPWAAGSGETGVAAAAPGTKPAFSSQLMKSPAGQGNDILRLTVTGDPSTGDPNGKWVLSLSDVKVDLGANVTPGELRLVPFTRNVQDNTTVADNWFYGNNDQLAQADPAREVGIYTVPAYVSPVNITMENQNITSDGSAQSVGQIKIVETNAVSLGAGTYSLNLEGATIANTSASQIRAALTNGGSTEQVSNVRIGPDNDTILFDLQGADASRTSTITLDGVLLSASTPGQIRWELEGGTVSEWLADADDTNGAITVAGREVAPSSQAFLGAPNETRNVVTRATFPTTITPTAQSTVTVAGTTGVLSDALPAGTYTVSNNGNTLTNGNIVLTRTGTTDVFTGTVPGTGAATDSYDITNVTATTRSFELGAPTPAVTPATAAAGTLALGVYTYTGTGATGDTLDLTGAPTLTRQANGTWTTPAGLTYTFATQPASNVTVANGAVVNSVGISPTVSQTGTAPTGTIAANPNVLPNATYTVSSDNNTITGGGVTLQRVGTSNTFRVTNAGGVTGVNTDQVFDVFNTAAGQQFVLNGGTVQSIVGGQVNATSGAENLVAGSYTVGGTVGALTITGGSWTGQAIQNGVAIDGPASGTGTVTLTGLAPGQTFTVTAAQVVAQTVTDYGVNQKDILAPTDDLTRTGTASAGETAIGGTDRFGTARKIAKAFSNYGDTAIIVNGMNFPDALSSGFLSQREGAPILLTAQGFVPQDTIESLRERGVRKVYIVGGEAAVGSRVADTLRNTDAYMWDEAANNLRPRGSKLEVIQLGGSDRYVTNWVVNTYAAAQTANNAPVGKINVGYGQSQKTTALVARGDQFADALTANLLTAGLRSSERVTVGQTARTVEVTRSFSAPVSGATQTISNADLQKFLTTGEYFVDYVAANDVRLYAGTSAASPATLVAQSTDGRVFAPVNSGLEGNITFGTAWTQDGNFALNVTQATPGSWQYNQEAARRNALPVILTPGNGLHSYSKNQLNALHIQHALLIGGDSALSKQVNDDVAATGATSYRLGGTNRFHTAQLVNMFAIADPTPKSDDPQYVPGLGFDGGRFYDSQNSPIAGNTEAQTDWVAYLANGLKFPDALVAGPWISYSRDAMLMTAGATDLSDPTRGFLTDYAPQIDRAAGLGLGNAVSSAVVHEANKIASSK